MKKNGKPTAMGTQTLFVDDGTVEGIPHRPDSPKKRKLMNALAVFTMDRLSLMIMQLAGKLPRGETKAKLCELLADILSFENKEEFDALIGAKSPLFRAVLEKTAFTGFANIRELEKKFGIPILERTREYGYAWSISLSASCGLSGLFTICDLDSLALDDFFRAFFVPFLPKPVGYDPEPLSRSETASWSNEEGIADTAPLVVDFIVDLEKTRNRHDVVQKGLLVAEARKFSEVCGLKDFPEGVKLKLQSGDLLTRFIAAFSPPKLARPADPDAADAWIKSLAVNFFSHERIREYTTENATSLFEFRCLLDYLTRRQGINYYNYLIFPHIRSAFRDALRRVAAVREWFSPDALYDSCLYRGQCLSLALSGEDANDLFLRGDSILRGDEEHERDPYEKNIAITASLYPFAIGRPLFKAYAYLFATLGILEIREAPPARTVRKGSELIPVSPYEALAGLRLTPFGAWCLDLKQEKPLRARKTSLILPDPDLLIITFKGESLEKRLFLDRIGTRLGDERYRVTDASFIAGCHTQEEIAARATRFGELVGTDIPPLWKRFLDGILKKSRVFALPQKAFIFTLPDDPEFRQAFRIDPVLKSLAIKAEGGRVAVPAGDFARLAKALEDRGFFCPTPKTGKKR